MSLRAPSPTLARRAAATAALAGLLALVVGLLFPTPDASAASGTRAPVVTGISPSKLSVGEKLTIRGRYFRAGKGRNTVVFKRAGSRAVFVKADISTSKLLRVQVPGKLSDFLAVSNGTPTFTRFRIRVLGERFGKRFSARAASPLVGPEKPPEPPTPPASSANGDCDSDGTPNGRDKDDDNDLLADSIELKIKTDSCKLDSDGDGAGDGYEYRAAVDLNNDEYQNANNSLPYPEKRPYPNALFVDVVTDFDGDGLTLGEEHSLWKLSNARSLNRLSYSDGLQYSIYNHPFGDDRRRGSLQAAGYDKQTDFINWTNANGYGNIHSRYGEANLLDVNRNGEVSGREREYNDIDGNGILSDDERDEDADGLTNFVESHGAMLPSFWSGCYTKEGTYPVPYSATGVADADSDGDGVRDGADDQDNDDIPNLMELSRSRASNQPVANNRECDDKDAKPSTTENSYPDFGYVNPFNPCLPDSGSRTCARYGNLGGKFAPFDSEVPYYFILN